MQKPTQPSKPIKINKTYRNPLQTMVILCLLTFSVWGCGTDSDNPSPSNPESPSFSGNWVIYETWQGCEGSGEDEIPIEITQSDDSVTLTVGGQSIDCNVIDLTLQCAGQLTHTDGTVHDYTDLTLWFDDNQEISGEARWTLSKATGETCSGTSTISSSPGPKNSSADDGALRIENSTLERFKLLNIVPCEVSFSPWGPNQLLEGNTLDPGGAYQINSIPEGCYSVRACREIEPFDNSGCIVYHQNIYVENNAVHTLALGVN